MKKAIFLVIVVLGLGILWQKYGYLTQSYRNLPTLKEITNTAPAKIVHQTSDPKLQHIKLPENFVINYYAPDVPGARSLTQSETGIVFVGTRKEGVVYALVDNNQDGRADERFVVDDNLNTPNGVAYKDGDLYVAEISRILRYKNIDQTFHNNPSPEIFFDGYPKDTHHGWKYIAFGTDGSLYVPVGAPCNICNPSDPYASITKLGDDGKSYQVIARGIRNTVGFAWHPITGNLWFTDNGRDWLGDNAPEDELNVVTSPEQNFGYPNCHAGRILDPQFGKTGDCDTSQTPAINLAPHVAALGLHFYQGDQFPSQYKTKAFIAEHGSWNSTVPVGYRVSTLDIQADSASNYQTFASGWLDETGDALGRPVDILELADGSILISDDFAGAIYKISYLDK